MAKEISKCKICDTELGVFQSYYRAQSTLLDHIRAAHRDKLDWVYAKQDEIGEIRREVFDATGYDILR